MIPPPPTGNFMPTYRSATSILALLLLAAACRAQPDRQTYQTLADEVHRHFDANVLHVWFPRCIDEKHGGFRSPFSPEVKPPPKQKRFLGFQTPQPCAPPPAR